ncbi:hypothetical protein PV409_22165 [Streptomyces sp. ME02-6979.5a]|uniref:hypothetical protein n=1 Tax=Streptomyces sp. ME02-6979.5a TaxID=462925 RepID=UPI0029B9329A|nr:hypothetical protein [Streptomyces sp. ME02-6979.5a]MDX3340665.1 hypothetical protein [Streptomyces sp. ME02-6979.5a]
MTEPAWVPPSCTLPTEEQPLRVAEWDALFAERLTALSRPSALRLRLDLAGGPGVAERVRELASRESACCSFFTFAASSGEDRVHLDVSVDEGHASVLEALAARAGAAVRR